MLQIWCPGEEVHSVCIANYLRQRCGRFGCIEAKWLFSLVPAPYRRPPTEVSRAGSPNFSTRWQRTFRRSHLRRSRARRLRMPFLRPEWEGLSRTCSAASGAFQISISTTSAQATTSALYNNPTPEAISAVAETAAARGTAADYSRSRRNGNSRRVSEHRRNVSRLRDGVRGHAWCCRIEGRPHDH